MRYEIISTGSKGNALLLYKEILIDCGVPYKRLKDEPIKLIVLTHEHKDYFNQKTIQKIHKARISRKDGKNSKTQRDFINNCR